MEVGMIAVIGFLSSTLGRVLVGAGGLLALWVTFALHYEGRGAQKTLAKVEANGERNAAKAASARRSVGKVPIDRLDDNYRRE
jgi:hypothetical protein